MIKISNVSKIFNDKSGEVVALRGVNLEISRGDIFGIIGMSGAGKSTLLRCLSTLETPTSGSITLDGTDLASLSGARLIETRRKMGVVFQGYNLLMQRTVHQNIAFPLTLGHAAKTDIDRRVKELLDLIGLADRGDSYPSQLSGGQKQRVAIARALATSPEVLLCDEPTSALDSLTTKNILELLHDINRKLNVTIVIITHEIAVVRAICNKVAVIDASEFVEWGDTAEIFKNPKHDMTKQLLGYEVMKK
ncbi:ATP-binding cassette domain-containing protein [Anaerotruncus colihominis]|uniref:ATP-binding cassette domain-containing protein n=1 Tax=Anaerotruncus colihominis TaxID=169435 RepID=A0A845RL22_9FIRM|nr:methionine ABC transporter ATP-binding protein [Anaerotruncus colihominis]NBI80249.1 ATP-binding cassette domain-containing protein [Anaerotruncus colihominis]